MKKKVFTGVRGRRIHRSSSNLHSRKFTSSIILSPGPMQQVLLCRVSKVHSPVYIRH
jgi:hypothetical protein